MANEKTKSTKQWSANDTQKAFMGALNRDSYLSLKQVSNALGKPIATGSINTLSAKELVKTKEKAVKYTATIVETRTYENGDIIVIEKVVEKAETGYKLV